MYKCTHAHMYEYMCACVCAHHSAHQPGSSNQTQVLRFGDNHSYRLSLLASSFDKLSGSQGWEEKSPWGSAWELSSEWVCVFVCVHTMFEGLWLQSLWCPHTHPSLVRAVRLQAPNVPRLDDSLAPCRQWPRADGEPIQLLWDLRAAFHAYTT